VLLAPRLPTRSRAAKSDVAIFITFTSFLFSFYTDSLGNARARPAPTLRKRLNAENQESYRWRHFPLESIVTKKFCRIIGRCPNTGVYAVRTPP
jgi:hypothetical protein